MDDFCLIHGREFMYTPFGANIANCSACERDQEIPNHAFDDAEGVCRMCGNDRNHNSHIA